MDNETITPKNCSHCDKEFMPKKQYYFICEECWQKEFPKAIKPTEACHALNLTGSQCGFKAHKGKYFCTKHLNLGYALFNKVVEKNNVEIGVLQE